MDEPKKRPDWRTLPYEDEEAMIRHFREYAVTPESGERAIELYLHVKRSHDRMRMEDAEAEASRSMPDSSASGVPEMQVA